MSPDWKRCPYCDYSPNVCSKPGCKSGWLPKEAHFCSVCGSPVKGEENLNLKNSIEELINRNKPHKRVDDHVDVLNPMDCGIILGKTTVADARKNPHEFDGKYPQCTQINRRDYWDHDCDGVIEHCYIVKSNGIPHQWIQAGLSFSMSYYEWTQWLSRNGFAQKAKKEPTISSDGGFSGSLVAEIEAYNKYTRMKLNLVFNYSKKPSVNDSDTLYSIKVEKEM